MEWYLTVLKKYATFEGRARRSEYWIFALINYGISFTLSIFSYMFRGGSGQVSFFSIISIVYGFAVLIPGLAVMVRRLHDVGKSGWYFFIILVPLIGWVLLLVALFIDSQPGGNKYGPNPKEGPDVAVLSISQDGTVRQLTEREKPARFKSQQGNPTGTAQEHFQKGWAFHQNERYDKAVEEYREALFIDPDFSLARSNLGMAYKLLGKQDDAIREWEEAINRGISDVVVKMNTEDWLSEAKALRDERLKPIEDVDSAVKSYLEELGKASDKWFVAYDALVRIGAPAVEPIIEGLKSNNDLLRNRSIDLLAKIGDKRAIAPLEEASIMSESDFRRITKMTGKSKVVNVGGLQVEIAFSKMLDEYHRLAREAVDKIKKQ